MAIYANQTNLMRKDAGSFGMLRLRKWGWRGAARAAGQGAAAAFGFFPTKKGGPLSFWGSEATASGSLKSRLKGAYGNPAIGGLVGISVWAATDNPLLGAAAGIATSAAMQRKMTGSMKGTMGAFGRGLMPGFMLLSAIEGYQEGGVGGAVGSVARDTVSFAAFDVGLKAAGTLLKGSRIAAAGSSFVSGLAGVARFAGPVAGLLAIGYTAYKGLDALAKLGRKHGSGAEFTGDMSAFMTEGAMTMRSRSLQEIQRSHTNSRTILGNEAQLMHL